MNPLRYKPGILFLLVVVNHLCAQHMNTWTVKVLDENNEPVERATIYTLEGKDKIEGKDRTNIKGICQINVSPFNLTREYYLNVYEAGYKRVLVPLDIMEDTVVIHMEPNPESVSRMKIEGMAYERCLPTLESSWYKPARIGDWDDLPKRIARKLKDHLLKKTGPYMFRQLFISGGQKIDIQRLFELDSIYRKGFRPVYPFNICVSFRDTASGIALYSSKVIMDKNGKVMEEFEFPVYDPSFPTYISLDEAKLIARKNECKGEVINYPQLSYANYAQQLRWELVYNDTNRIGKNTYRSIAINAFTQKIESNYLLDLGLPKDSNSIFKNIFGSSCDLDTLQLIDKTNKMTEFYYVLKENRTVLVAYKQHQELWRMDVRDLFGSAETRISCWNFNRINPPKVYLRLDDNKQDKTVYLDLETRKTIKQETMDRFYERNRLKSEKQGNRRRKQFLRGM